MEVFKVNDCPNGANTSFFKPAVARKALKPGEKERSELFYRAQAEQVRRLREAQRAAR